MIILQAHNFYQQGGGEDTVVRQERDMLEAAGHTVIPYYKHNDEIRNYGWMRKAAMVRTTTWSAATYGEVRELIQTHRPDVLHVHNFLPLITPSIYDAAEDEGVPVVQTLHNYRLICANGLFLRGGKVCEDCLGGSPAPAVRHKCYRNSHVQSYAVARMLKHHWAAQTWNAKVDRFLCFTEFARQKFVAHGLEPSRISVKPNCLAERPEPSPEREPYALYVGRLDAYKGIPTLLAFADHLPEGLRLKVIGDGAMADAVRHHNNIEYLGSQPRERVMAALQKARMMLFPSECYEGMPMTILEAMALATPVVASRMGAMEHMIRDRETGMLFEPGNADALRAAVEALWTDHQLWDSISQSAHQVFLSHYTREAGLSALEGVYQQVVHAR